METKEEFMIAAAQEFVATLVAPERLDAAMEGIKIARYNEGFLEALLLGAERHEAHVNAKNRTKSPSIEYLMSRDPDGDGMDLFRRTANWLDKLGRGTVLCNGYRPDTMQAALTVHLFADRPLEEQLQILDFVPHIKPVDGYKLLGVMEPSLSASGIHQIKIAADGQCIFGKYSGSRALWEKHFDDLRQCLAYVHAHHGNESHWEEEDDDVDEG